MMYLLPDVIYSVSARYWKHQQSGILFIQFAD